MDQKIKYIYIGLEDTYENSDANMFKIDIKDVSHLEINEPYENLYLNKNELKKTKYCKFLHLVIKKTADRVLCKDKDNKEITLIDRISKHDDLFSIDFYDEDDKWIDGVEIPWDSIYNKTKNPFQKTIKHKDHIEIVVEKQNISNQEWLDDYYFTKKYF